MKHTEMVIAAVNALNRNKNTNIKILEVNDGYIDGPGAVNLTVSYQGGELGRTFGFTQAGFDVNGKGTAEFLRDFKVDESLKEKNPTMFIILRIAYYLGRLGRYEKAG